jgi:hypothetical protein
METDEGRNEDPLSLHNYAYCSDDPVNRSDPSGLEWTDVYIWDADIKAGSVGHAMLTAHGSHSVFLSQFPHKRGEGSSTFSVE